MFVSNRKRQANRRNAQKSTGPRTFAGQDRAKMNAVTHGIFCQHLVLHGENARLFEQFRHTYLMEYSPQNLVELMLVDRIVSASWRLRRLHSAENCIHTVRAQQMREREKQEKDDARYALTKEPSAHISASNEAGEEVPAIAALAASFIDDSPTLERLSRYEQRLEQSIYRAMRQLEKIRKTEPTPPKICPFVPTIAYACEDVDADANANVQNEPKVKLGGLDDAIKRDENLDSFNLDPAGDHLRDARGNVSRKAG